LLIKNHCSVLPGFQKKVFSANRTT
jgi:hypothetical protein